MIKYLIKNLIELLKVWGVYRQTPVSVACNKDDAAHNGQYSCICGQGKYGRTYKLYIDDKLIRLIILWILPVSNIVIREMNVDTITC